MKNKFMTMSGLFLIIISLLMMIFLIRNILVFEHRGRALEFVYSKQDNDWRKRRCDYVKYSYSGQVLSFNKWTYRQMFPELYELEQKEHKD